MLLFYYSWISPYRKRVCLSGNVPRLPSDLISIPTYNKFTYLKYLGFDVVFSCSIHFDAGWGVPLLSLAAAILNSQTLTLVAYPTKLFNHHNLYFLN